MQRCERVAEEIRKEASNIIHHELKDPRLGFITITQVELTRDLRYAKIFFSVLGKEEERKKSREALESALGFIRRLVAERINLRFAPEIIFREDRSSEYRVRIEEILQEIKKVEVPKKDEPKKTSRRRKKI